MGQLVAGELYEKEITNIEPPIVRVTRNNAENPGNDSLGSLTVVVSALELTGAEPSFSSV